MAADADWPRPACRRGPLPSPARHRRPAAAGLCRLHGCLPDCCLAAAGLLAPLVRLSRQPAVAATLPGFPVPGRSGAQAWEFAERPARCRIQPSSGSKSPVRAWLCAMAGSIWRRFRRFFSELLGWPRAQTGLPEGPPQGGSGAGSQAPTGLDPEAAPRSGAPVREGRSRRCGSPGGAGHCAGFSAAPHRCRWDGPGWNRASSSSARPASRDAPAAARCSASWWPEPPAAGSAPPATDR
jgi:hypothetical protein